MKVIFLDINGVMDEGSTSSLRKALHPKHMAVLNEVVRASGADVVLASAYRMVHSVSDIRGIFKAAGFEGKVVGKTPMGMGRDAEIQTYLNEHPNIEAFVILDDASDLGVLTSKLVCTYPNGLESHHVSAALGHLKESL